MPLNSTKREAILFFARDFLAYESSLLGSKLTERSEARVYIITSEAERSIIVKNDVEAIIYNLTTLIETRKHDINTPIWENDHIGFSFNRFNNDRYLIREDAKEIKKLGVGLHRLVHDLEKSFQINCYFDEPVSGVVNDLLNFWVKKQGGKPIHFNFSWVPGYMFAVSGAGQDAPIPIRQVTDAHELVKAHMQNRLNKQALPTYVRNYNNPFRKLSAALSWYCRGYYRKFFKTQNYFTKDPWPQFFHARALLGSIFQKQNGKKTVAPHEKRVIFPLHYEPEAVINYFGTFLRQEELAAQLLEHLPPDAVLILKEHPSQIGATTHKKWDFLRQCKRVIMTRGDVGMDQVLDKKSIVVSIGSTAVLDALSYGFPVILLGKHHMASMPGVVSTDKVSDIVWNWQNFDIETTRQAIIDYYTDFLYQYGFKGQILKGATDTTDIATLFNNKIL